MSFKRFIEQVGENLAKNAQHASGDTAALKAIREGALKDVHSVVADLKPADILKKQATISADMNTIFLRENVPPQERKRIMDAILDAAKNPPPEPPPIPSTRPTRTASDSRNGSSVIVDSSGRPIEAIERRSAAEEAAAARPSAGPAPSSTSAPPPRPAAAGGGRPPEPPSGGLTGNQAADADLLGGRAEYAKFDVGNRAYWQGRGATLNRITGAMENANASPRKAMDALAEFEKDFMGVVNDLPYEGVKPVKAEDVIAKIRKDERIYASGKPAPQNGELPIGVKGITRAEYQAVRSFIHEPLAKEMTSQLRSGRWNNTFTADDFARYRQALLETGHFENGSRPSGNLKPADALNDVAKGGKIYEDEFSALRRLSPKSDAVVKAESTAAGGAIGGTGGMARAMNMLQSAASLPGRTIDFLGNPIRWGATGTAWGRGAVVAGVLASGVPLTTLMADTDPKLTGTAQITYNAMIWRANHDEDYKAKLRLTQNPDEIDQRVLQYLSEVDKDTSGAAADASAKAQEATQRKITEGSTAFVRDVTSAVKPDSGKGVVEADRETLVAEQYEAGHMTATEMDKLLTRLTQASGLDGNVKLSKDEYALVKSDPAYSTLKEDAKKALDQRFDLKFGQ